MALGDRRDIRIDVTVDSDTRGGKEASAELGRIDASASKAGKSLKGLTEESKKLNVEMARSRDRIRELGAAFTATGDRSILIDLRKERSALAEFKRIAKEAAAAGVSAASKGASFSFDGIGAVKGPAIAALVGAAALAAPAIGAIIAGAVAGTAVGGGIAGGVIAASNDTRVRLAFKNLASEFTAEAFGAGAFVGPVVQGIGILKDEFRDLNLDETFAKGASSVPILAQGIGDLVNNTMPGFNKVMDQAEAFTEVFADGLGDTGAAIGDLLGSLVESEGTIEGLEFGFKALNTFIIGTGNTLQWLGDRFHDMVVFGADFNGVMEDAVRGLENVARATTQVLSFGLINLDDNHGLSGMFASWNDSLEETEAVGYHAASSVASVVKVLREGDEASAKAAGELKKLNDEFERSINLEASLLHQQIDFQEGLQNLADLFAENGPTLDIFTDAGRENADALVSMAEEARRTRETQIELNGSVVKANEALEISKEAIYAQAEAAGISRAAVELLIGALFRVPTLTYAQIITELRGPTFNEATGEFGKRAAGGSVAAGGAYLVGDGGRAEVLQMGSQSGYIYPSVGAYQNAMGGGGSSGGAQTVNLTIPVYVGTQELRRIQIDDALNRGVPAATVAAAYP